MSRRSTPLIEYKSLAVGFMLGRAYQALLQEESQTGGVVRNSLTRTAKRSGPLTADSPRIKLVGEFDAHSIPRNGILSPTELPPWDTCCSVHDVPASQSGLAALEEELEAFAAMLPSLLPSLAGRFVAIHKGAMIDSDADEFRLAARVEPTAMRSGPVAICQVADQRPTSTSDFDYWSFAFESPVEGSDA